MSTIILINFIANISSDLNGLDVNSDSGQDTVLWSILPNFTTNWVTSLDFAGYSQYTPSFIIDDKVYVSLTGTNNLFWLVELIIDTGEISKFKWYNFSSIESGINLFYVVVSNKASISLSQIY